MIARFQFQVFWVSDFFEEIVTRKYIYFHVVLIRVLAKTNYKGGFKLLFIVL